MKVSKILAVVVDPGDGGGGGGGGGGGSGTAPVITSNQGVINATISINENTAAVQTLAATNPAAGTTLTWSITGGEDAAKFTINATTGALSFIAAPDFETRTDVNGDNAYVVLVRASNGLGFEEQTIIVNVNDLNDNPPVIRSGLGGVSAAISILETSTSVTTVSAADAGAGTAIFHAIVGGADAGQFAINAASGALKKVKAVGPPDMIISDLWLASDWDGFALVRAIREHASIGIPALIITADFMAEHPGDALLSVMQKPVDPNELLAAAERMAPHLAPTS